MYKGKRTLFYNGETLWNGGGSNGSPLIYNVEERQKWEVIMVLPGVEVIPECTFSTCTNVKTVIMNDTVRRIEWSAFDGCISLEFVRLSRNLEIIGFGAFGFCKSLTSIFIPPSCREIRDCAFRYCKKLIIFNVPLHTTLGRRVFANTALIEASHFELNISGNYENHEEVNEWVKSINIEQEYALHRACTSFNPLSDIIHALVQREGIKAMKMPNAIGITPSHYLAANMFADISEKEIVNRYILDMMGETF